MAIIKNEQSEQMFEAFKQFSHLYRCKVEFTGEKLRKVADFDIPMDPSQPIKYTEINELAIKMPQDEFEKFMKGWANYIDLMHVAATNPMVGEEYHKLHMLVQLLK